MEPLIGLNRAAAGRAVLVALLALAVLVGGCDLGGSRAPGGSPARVESPGSRVPVASGAPAAFAPDGPTVEARVDRVVDGDTIIVILVGSATATALYRDRHARSVKPDTPVERMGREATAANEALVEGRTVVLETDVSDTDRFGRLLRDVWVERDGVLVLVNLELVRMGFAHVTTFPPDVKYADRLLAALDEARAAGVGLWGPDPAP